MPLLPSVPIRLARLAALLALLGCFGALTLSSDALGLQAQPAHAASQEASNFPTVWGLSKRRYRAISSTYVVREQFVVAFEDGTYSTNMAALHGADGDAPGSGDRLGEWRIEGDRLLTRFDDPDGEFRPQYFPNHRTRPGAPGQRLSGCYSGTEIRLTFRFRKICFEPDGSYQREDGDLASGRSRMVSGAYSIDGHRLTLQERGADEVRTAFAILTGEPSAPTSVVIDRERFSR